MLQQKIHHPKNLAIVRIVGSIPRPSHRGFDGRAVPTSHKVDLIGW